jgi:ATP-dependent helicase/nuclease subunit B
MERAGLLALDDFDQQALLDEALDSAVVSESGGLGELSEGVGFREKVHGAVVALRLAGIDPERLDAARLGDWRKRLFLLRMLQRYERLLSQRRRADTATILRFAISALESEGGSMPSSLGADAVFLLPGLGTRGLTGRFVSALGARGARVLETDPVVGLDLPDFVLWNRPTEPTSHSHLYAPETPLTNGEERPDIGFFHAASIVDELREVLRRALESGLRLDEIEIVTADPSSYGSALHALSARLGVPVTYAVGLPVERTRTGRVVRTYLDWIEEGFQANPVRRLLEAGDLRAPSSRGRHAPAALARRFRSLRVGWGRKRYRSQIRSALAGVDNLQPGKWEAGEAFERRRDRAASELKALRSILFPTLKATPAVPDRLGEGAQPVSPAEIARGLQAFLRRVPRGKGPDRAAREEVERILERVEATLRRRTDFRAAVTILRRHLEFRVRAEEAVPGLEAGAPWSSEGGHVHLSDLEHGGFTGRPVTFIIGLDSDGFPGAANQDPVLLDSDRRILGDSLPTSAELLRERVFGFAALIARLRGRIVMSYRAWSAMEARSVSPSPVLLQALRLRQGDPGLTFHDLRQELGRVVCAVPAAGRPPLDADDVWLAELGRGDVMRKGLGAIRAAFPRLDVGLAAKQERETGDPGRVHGVIQPRPDELDPRRNESIVVSASRLEALGSCPLRYLQSTVLRIRPPDDPELDPDSWLDPLRRGGLLHRVFEGVLRSARERGVKYADAGFETLALEVLDEDIRSLRDEVPVPGEGTLMRESAALREDVRSFVRMVRQLGAPWVRLEFGFGLAEDEPVSLDLPEGALRLRGAIDRVDDPGIEGVRIVDYKTGVARGFGGSGVFNGGRRLQHALYAHAVESRLGGQVAAGEYHFPTRRGENQAHRFDRLGLAGVADLLGHMLDGVAAGRFVPTNDPDDCRFCDFAEICRVRRGEFGKVNAPLADWSEQHLNTGLQPAFGHLKRVRTFED